MLRWQVGQFLILLGIIGLIVFFVTDQVKQTNCLYFCSGVLVLILGVYAMWTGRNPPQPSERFRFFRKKKDKSSEEEKK
jgi:sugar phosphate permease